MNDDVEFKVDEEEKIQKLDAIFTANLDLIPVANYGFSQEVLHNLRKEKHTKTNAILTKNEKKSLSKGIKQNIARGLDANNQTVSKVLELMKNTDIMPRNPKFLKIDDTTSNMKIPEIKKIGEKIKETKLQKRNKFKGKDYERLLKKAEKRNEKIINIKKKNPDKAKKIEQNILWEKVIKRAEGEKVKDNIDLLKKGLKNKQKRKKKSKQKWSERKRIVQEKQIRKQEKRSENIRKRKAEQIKNKQKKRFKKGT